MYKSFEDCVAHFNQEADLENFNWKQPQYAHIHAARGIIEDYIELSPEHLAEAHAYYRADRPVEFITHLGNTFDPRASNKRTNPFVPFIPFEHQIESINWLLERFKNEEYGIWEKSRDMGATWIFVGFGVYLWMYYPGATITIASRKEDIVHKKDDMDSIFPRILMFIRRMPRAMLPNELSFHADSDIPKTFSHMHLFNPDNGALLRGEAGVNIGRGGRASVVFCDEKAFMENQEATNAALASNTNCQIDVSTFSGAGNDFYYKSRQYRGTKHHHISDWKQDPRKDQEWYDNYRRHHGPEITAQEVDRNPLAAQGESFIEPHWLDSAIDAHKHLGFEASGIKIVSFDPSDEGADPKAVICRHGNVIENALLMDHGDGSDGLFWAMEVALEYGADIFIYDAEVMYKPAMKTYLKFKRPNWEIVPFYGSRDPDDKNMKFDLVDVDVFGEADTSGLQTNNDRLENKRAQYFYKIRERFRRTHEAICRWKENLPPEGSYAQQFISISSKCKELDDLIPELTITKRMTGGKGKIKAESKKEMRSRNVRSPNLADCTMMSEAGHHPKIMRSHERSTRIHTPRTYGYNPTHIIDPRTGY